MKIEFNINEQIKVKLTKYGQKILAETNKTMIFNPDKNGYYNFSLWKFAHIFGEHLYNGQMKQPIENNKIIMEFESHYF